MSIVKDLNLRPDSKPDLRTSYSEKSPKTQIERIAVIVYYLRRVLELEGVTPNHVFTCLRQVGAHVPADMPQAIRLVANRKGWVDTADANQIDITTQGENLVEHDLSHGSA